MSEEQLFDVPVSVGSCDQCEDVIDIFEGQETSTRMIYLCLRCSIDMGFGVWGERP